MVLKHDYSRLPVTITLTIFYLGSFKLHELRHSDIVTPSLQFRHFSHVTVTGFRENAYRSKTTWKNKEEDRLGRLANRLEDKISREGILPRNLLGRTPNVPNPFFIKNTGRYRTWLTFVLLTTINSTRYYVSSTYVIVTCAMRSSRPSKGCQAIGPWWSCPLPAALAYGPPSFIPHTSIASDRGHTDQPKSDIKK